MLALNHVICHTPIVGGAKKVLSGLKDLSAMEALEAVLRSKTLEQIEKLERRVAK